MGREREGRQRVSGVRSEWERVGSESQWGERGEKKGRKKEE